MDEFCQLCCSISGPSILVRVEYFAGSDRTRLETSRVQANLNTFFTHTMWRRNSSTFSPLQLRAGNTSWAAAFVLQHLCQCGARRHMRRQSRTCAPVSGCRCRCRRSAKCTTCVCREWPSSVRPEPLPFAIMNVSFTNWPLHSFTPLAPTPPPPAAPHCSFCFPCWGGDYLQDSWVEIYLQDINGHFWVLCKRAADKMFWDESHVEQRLIRDDKLTQVFTGSPVISHSFFLVVFHYNMHKILSCTLSLLD